MNNVNCLSRELSYAQKLCIWLILSVAIRAPHNLITTNQVVVKADRAFVCALTFRARRPYCCDTFARARGFTRRRQRNVLSTEQ